VSHFRRQIHGGLKRFSLLAGEYSPLAALEVVLPYSILQSPEPDGTPCGSPENRTKRVWCARRRYLSANTSLNSIYKLFIMNALDISPLLARSCVGFLLP
jgi:hypothetical protein